jgi:sugar lactone lactonase YvrE
MNRRVLRVVVVVLLCIAITAPSSIHQIASAQTPILGVEFSGALSVQVFNERPIAGGVIADITLRNLAPAWYLVTRAGGNAITQRQVDYAFVIGPLQTMTFRNLQFSGVLPGQGDFLRFSADRSSPIALEMLAIDTLFRTFFGASLPTSFLDPGVPDAFLSFTQTLLTAFPSGTDLSNALVDVQTLQWLDAVQDFSAFLVHNRQFVQTVVGELHRLGVVTDAQFARFVGTRLVNLLVSILTLQNAALAIELLFSTATAPATGVARLTLPSAGQLTRLVAAPAPIVIASGQRVTIEASGNVPVNPTWTVVPSSLGTLSAAQGARVEFTAGHVGTGRVVARQGGLPATVRVRVVSGAPIFTGCQLSGITVTPNSIAIAAGTSQGFAAVGICADGRDAVINATWSVTGGIGTVSSATGTTTMLRGTTPGLGTVQASAQGLTASATVQVTGTATGSRVYIVDSENDRIVRIDDLTGSGWTVLALPFHEPDGVAVSSDGHIYIADQVNNRIVRVNDMTGNGFVAFGSLGSGTNQFSVPARVALDSAGRIYVVDHINHRIVRINDMTGAGWTTFGSQGTGIGQFSFPDGIAIDPAGRIYVADNNNHRIVRINDMTGAGWTTIGSPGAGVSQFNFPEEISFDASGRIYVADFSNNRVVRIDDMTGTAWTTFGSLGSGVNQFSGPVSIAVDGTGRIYVADRFNSRVVRFNDMSGSGWTAFGSLGSGVNQFSGLVAISVR